MEPIKSITLAYNELIFAWKLSPFSFVRSYSTYCSTEIDWSHFRWYFLFVLCSKDHLETRRVYTCYTLTDTYYQRASLVAQMVKIPPAIQETGVQFLGQEDPLEKGIATHYNILPWRIPWTEEPGELWFMGLQRGGHDWVTNTFTTKSLLIVQKISEC